MLLKSIKVYTDAFVELFYPNLCLACGESVPFKERHLCLECEGTLPFTNFHLYKENPIIEKFAGRVKIEKGGALFYFSKTSRVQQLIHQLKYHRQSQIGVQLGRMYGIEVKESGYFEEIDFIVPVPLHSKKEKQRGYNQSDVFAQGLSQTLEKPWRKNALVRVEYTETQTKKDVINRFENVKQAFKVGEPKQLKNKHVLLVDDVITTGATLEACVLKLLEIENCTVSIATIAFAEH